MSKKIWIGAIINRDLEIFSQILKFLKTNYANRLGIVSFLKKDGSFSKKYFRKKLKKYPISFLIVKLHSTPSNQIIYNAIKSYCPNIPLLNSLRSVSACESRRETFKFIQKNFKKLYFPKSYFSLKEAYEAAKDGIPIIIKLDVHNDPYISKYDRIIGIAKSKDELMNLIRNYDPTMLFFQEYLGKFDIVYKTYVIDKFAVCITAHNRLQSHKLSQIELIHIRVPIEKKFKRRIKQIGRKLGMTVFGVDYVVKNGKQYIVDVNDFPSFRNVPEAVSLISDYIYNLTSLNSGPIKIPTSVVWG
ncbi:MAG: hypothetical protein JW891_13430 [Candidatus Lokiarchaeota archaeon]|nr:hypothetical protein [Candidatus Lokiarchaeota archaeon]